MSKVVDITGVFFKGSQIEKNYSFSGRNKRYSCGCD